MSEGLKDGEQLNDLGVAGLTMIQSDAAFRFGMDAVFLAHFAHVGRQACVADLGTGTGILPLLLSTRGAAHITGVEINAAAAGLACRNVALNHLDERITILQGDLRAVRTLPLTAGGFDLVVANPPYYPLHKGKVSANSAVAQARHEFSCTLDDVVRAASYLVKYRGRFSLVYVSERLPELILVLEKNGLTPKRMRFVHALAGKKPAFFLLEAIRGGAAGLDVLPPLCIYQADGTYTAEVAAYYGANDRKGIMYRA